MKFLKKYIALHHALEFLCRRLVPLKWAEIRGHFEACNSHVCHAGAPHATSGIGMKRAKRSLTKQAESQRGIWIFKKKKRKVHSEHAAVGSSLMTH